MVIFKPVGCRPIFADPLLQQRTYLRKLDLPDHFLFQTIKNA